MGCVVVTKTNFVFFSTKGRRHGLDYLHGYKRSLLTYCTRADHDKELLATFEHGETVKAVIFWRRSIPARLSIQTWQSNMVKAFQEIEQYCHE